jgi:hypothetical protein
MQSKLVPIRFNKDTLREIDTLAELMVIQNSYGKVPLVMRFAISYTLASLNTLISVIPTLPEDKAVLLLDLVKRAKVSQAKQEFMPKKALKPKNFIPTKPDSYTKAETEHEVSQ